MKSIRYGGGVTKVYPVISQQIDEITAVTGESNASLISRLVSVEYDRVIIHSLEKIAAFWEKEYHALYDKVTAQLNHNPRHP